MQKWNLIVFQEFKEWLQRLPVEHSSALLIALKSITKETTGPWEAEVKDVSIHKITGEFPDLYCLYLIPCNIGVLYGLAGKFIILGAFGGLQNLKNRHTINASQIFIKKQKGEIHG